MKMKALKLPTINIVFLWVFYLISNVKTYKVKPYSKYSTGKGEL